MEEPTKSREAEWALRTPGIRVVKCPDCGGVRVDLGGPHALRFNTAGVYVDCVGREHGARP